MSPSPVGRPPEHIHIEKKKAPLWPWALLALLLLGLLLFGLSRCQRQPEPVQATALPAAVVPAPATVIVETPPPATATAPVAATPAGVSGLGAYLAGTDATPRTFQFERVNFDTAKSAIRPQDQAEIDDIAKALGQTKTTHARLTGYADTRGSEAANVALGKARADAVKAALVAKGIAADRLDTASGGDADPVASNATAAGQAENRRTELTVTQR